MNFKAILFRNLIPLDVKTMARFQYLFSHLKLHPQLTIYVPSRTMVKVIPQLVWRTLLEETMNLCQLICAIILVGVTCGVHSKNHPDTDRNLEQLIKSRGFNYQLYQVKTDDGVNIAVARILPPTGDHLDAKNSSSGTDKKPIILQHGFFGEATDFLINDGRGHFNEGVNDENVGGSLAFELAKCGYDVWLPNSRGNRYSELPRNRKYRKYQKLELEIWIDLNFIFKIVNCGTFHSMTTSSMTFRRSLITSDN